MHGPKTNFSPLSEVRLAVDIGVESETSRLLWEFYRDSVIYYSLPFNSFCNVLDSFTGDVTTTGRLRKKFSASHLVIGEYSLHC